MKPMITLLAVATVALPITQPSWSASLHVSPVTLRLPPGQGAVGITLSNPGEKPMVAQVRLFAWSQDLAEDHLAAQQELMVSPPIANIPAHGEQVVRIVRPANAAPQKELTFRLLVDELPETGAGAGDAAVDIRIRYSVPLFVLPVGHSAEPRLSWSLSHHNEGWFLKATNPDRTHAQLSAVKLIGADGQPINVAEGLLGYTLAGGEREWRLSDSAQLSGNYRVNASVNGHPIDAAVVTEHTATR